MLGARHGGYPSHMVGKRPMTDWWSRRTFMDLLVSLIPFSITSPAWTKTHPTGVSSFDRACSAYRRAKISELKTTSCCGMGIELAMSKACLMKSS